MVELEHTSRCTRHCGPDAFIILQSRVDAYKFFFPRTVSDWNSFPSSARSTPSVNSFKTALHRLSGVTSIVITEPCHSSSKGCTPMAGYSLKNWKTQESKYRTSVQLRRPTLGYEKWRATCTGAHISERKLTINDVPTIKSVASPCRGFIGCPSTALYTE